MWVAPHAAAKQKPGGRLLASGLRRGLGPRTSWTLCRWEAAGHWPLGRGRVAGGFRPWGKAWSFPDGPSLIPALVLNTTREPAGAWASPSLCPEPSPREGPAPGPAHSGADRVRCPGAVSAVDFLGPCTREARRGPRAARASSAPSSVPSPLPALHGGGPRDHLPSHWVSIR